MAIFKWVEATDIEAEESWEQVAKCVNFSPYESKKTRPAEIVLDIPQPFMHANPDCLRVIITALEKCVERLRDARPVICLDWHHANYRFEGDSFKFIEEIEVPPNGDYLFFGFGSPVSWIMFDGIEEEIHLYGEELATEYRLLSKVDASILNHSTN